MFYAPLLLVRLPVSLPPGASYLSPCSARACVPCIISTWRPSSLFHCLAATNNSHQVRGQHTVERADAREDGEKSLLRTR